MSECQYHQRKAKDESIKTYMQNLEKWYRQTYLQSRNKDRYRKQIRGRQGGERAGRDKLRDGD